MPHRVCTWTVATTDHCTTLHDSTMRFDAERVTPVPIDACDEGVVVAQKQKHHTSAALNATGRGIMRRTHCTSLPQAPFSRPRVPKPTELLDLHSYLPRHGSTGLQPSARHSMATMHCSCTQSCSLHAKHTERHCMDSSCLTTVILKICLRATLEICTF